VGGDGGLQLVDRVPQSRHRGIRLAPQQMARQAGQQIGLGVVAGASDRDIDQTVHVAR
jgi:hypothetical protein